MKRSRVIFIRHFHSVQATTGRDTRYFVSTLGHYLVFLLAFIPSVVVAQTTAPNSPTSIVGIDPYGSYSKDVDQINLSDLGLHIDIPLFNHQTQRGGAPGVAVHLVYDSSYLDFDQVPGSQPNEPVVIGNVGWRIQAGDSQSGTVNVVSANEGGCVRGQTGCTPEYDATYSFTDLSGYSHQFGVYTGTTHYPSSVSQYALDGSGYLLTVTNSTTTVTTPAGVVYSAPPVLGNGSQTDSNGNTSNYYRAGTDVNSYTGLYGAAGSEFGPQTFTDTSGMSVQISGGGYSPVSPAAPTSRNPVYITYTDTTGTTRQVVVTYKMYNVLPDSAQFISNSPYATPLSFRYLTALVDSVTYPDGSAYHFTYQISSFTSGVPDGQLASMQLPTGGTITYGNTWAQQACQPGLIGSAPGALLTSVARTTIDGATTYASTRNSTATGTGGACPTSATSTTQINRPDGTSEEIQFVGIPEEIPTVPLEPSSGNITYHQIETEHAWYSGSNTLLKSVQTCYNSISSNCATTAFSLPINQIATTAALDGGPSSKTVTILNSLALPTEVDEYDFGASSPTRKTLTQFASLGNNISNRPSSIIVTDGSGNPASKVTYGYDEYTLSGLSLLPTTGLSGHNVITGARGNRTSQHEWLLQSNTSLDTYWQYDDAGQVQKIIDPRTNWIATKYDAATDTCPLTISYTTPSSGVPVSISQTCDPNTGLTATSTDMNAVKTTYSYDVMLRAKEAEAATSTGTVVADTQYSYTIYGGSSSPATMTTTVLATPNPSEISSVAFDGLGRTSTATSASGAIVSTTYDNRGRVYSVSKPYFSTQIIYGSTLYTYDALGRTIQQTQPDGTSLLTWCYDNLSGSNCRKNASTSNTAGAWVDFTDEVGNHSQKSSDGLGRLIGVMEPNSSGAPGIETDYQYDLLNNLLQVNQTGGSGNIPRVRTFTYDSLSRILTATNPESGTVCYGPIVNGSCTSGYDPNGNLGYKTDARGILKTYVYDSLNRVLSKTNSDGTPSSCYAYDSVASGVGRLASEWTQSGSCPTTPSNPQTETSVLAYDPLGRINSQSTVAPNISTNISATYDLAGNEISLTYPDTRTVANGIDSAGRQNAITYTTWNGVAANPTQSYFSETNGYDAAGHLIGAVVGSSLPFITAAYDSRERPSSLTYGSSSAPAWSKQYGWTPNSNLQTQTDLITGIQRQFNYDNLNRLTAAQDIYSSAAVASGSNDQTTSTTTSGSGAEEAPGVTGAQQEWTDPDDSNLLSEFGAPYARWAFYNAVIALYAGAAPDGTQTAIAVRSDVGITSSLNDTYFSGAVAAPWNFSLETMTGTVWLKSQTAALKTINIYIIANGTVAGVKTVPLTSAWQQVQVTAAVPDNLTSLQFQIGGGGSVTNTDVFLMWNPMLEDEGIAGTSVTNFLPYSQLVTGAGWGGASYSTTLNSAAAPDSSQTAATITAGTGTGAYYISDTVGNPAPMDLQPVTGSVYLRSASSISVVVSIMETVSGTSSVCKQSTVALTTNWQRVILTCTAQNTLSQLSLQVGGGGFVNSAQFNLWGAQMELASQAGPYVATAATPVTQGTTLTNLLTYSQQPNGPSWFGSNQFSGVADSVAAPDGSQTGYQATSTAASGWLTNDISNPALYDSATVTASIYLRVPSGTESINFYLIAVGNSGWQILQQVPVSLTTTWQRFTATAQLPNGLTRLYIQVGNTQAAGQVVDVWGSQMELASHAGPYVETTALPVITGSDPTNILPNSQKLSGSNWGMAVGGCSTSSIAAPDGSTTAALCAAQSTAVNSYLRASVPNPSLYDGETVTASVYLRTTSASSQNINLYLENTGDQGPAAVVTSQATVPVQLTNTWQRFDLTGTVQNGLTTLSLQIGGANSLANGANFLIWGAQFTIGSQPAPYTITNGPAIVYATGAGATLVPTGLNQTYAYDSFGNILQNGSFTSAYYPNNRLFGYAYDASGNLLSDGMNIMTWDAESRMSTVGGATYIYDAEGNRVEKQGSAVMDTVYFGGQPIARYAGGQWTDLIYGPTGLLAEVPGTSAALPTYRVTDSLGTNVGTLLPNGTFTDPVDHTPFGQVFAGTTSDPYLFTGKERDVESGLDYFGARYYNSNMGRFISADWNGSPDAVPYADFSNPQSLNLYSYAKNNPTTNLDFDGHWSCDFSVPDSYSDDKGGNGITVTDNGCHDDPWDLIGSSLRSVIRDASDVSHRSAPSTVSAVSPAVCTGAAVAGGASAGTLIGGEVGGVLGGLIGGGGGTLVAPGVGTIGGGIAGASAGSGIGAVIGGFIGGLAGGAASNVLCSTNGNTVHGGQRGSQRGFSQADIDQAKSSAEETGQVTTQIGKYGTPQTVYNGTNGLTVVVETVGRNAGKVITGWWR